MPVHRCDSSNCLICSARGMGSLGCSPSGSRRGSLDEQAKGQGQGWGWGGSWLDQCARPERDQVVPEWDGDWRGRAEWNPATSSCSARKQSTYSLGAGKCTDLVVTGICVSDCSKYFAACTTSKDVLIHNVSHEAALGTRQEPKWTHRFPSKLSSVVWHKGDMGACITVGDFDGGLMQTDIETGHVMNECDEHRGSKVNDIAYGAGTNWIISGACNGGIQLWSCDLASNLAIRAPAPSSACCGVAFDPYRPFELAAALSDGEVHMFDARSPGMPYHVWRACPGYPAAHVSYLAGGMLACAGLNSEVKVVNVTRGDGGDQGPAGCSVSSVHRSYRGHCQTKHFVGMAAHRGKGLLALGSEDGGARVYAVSGDGSGPVASCRLTTDEAGCVHAVSGGFGQEKRVVGKECTAVQWWTSPEEANYSRTAILLAASSTEVAKFTLESRSTSPDA